MSQYPVVAHHNLKRVPSRIRFLGRRRDLSELPQAPSGAVLVASVDGHAELLRERDLSPTNETVVNASSVAVVDIRPERSVVTELRLGSADVHEEFVVRVSFSCHVIDAEMVVDRAAHDVTPVLYSHLMRDRELTSLGRGYEASEFVDFEDRVRARIDSLCEVRPPVQPGMTIRLDHVEVIPPQGYVDHSRAISDEDRRQALLMKRATFARNDARVIEEILRRGPEAIEALFLALDDDRYMNSLDRADLRRNVTEAQLREMFLKLTDRGHFDAIPIDSPRLMSDLLDRLLRPNAGDDGEPTYVVTQGSGGGRGPGPSIDRGDAAARPEVGDGSSSRPSDLPDEM